jgi:hypothetical protein
VEGIRAKLEHQLEELERWRSLSASTDAVAA